MERPSCRDSLEFAAASQFVDAFKGKLRLGKINASQLEEALVQPLANAETLEHLHMAFLRVLEQSKQSITAANWALKLLARFEESLSVLDAQSSLTVGQLVEERDENGALLHYQMLPLETRAHLLYEVCMELSEMDVIRKHVKECGAAACRAQPVGCDARGLQYWSLSLRLYQEEPAEFTGRIHNRKMKSSGQLNCIAISLEEWEEAIELLRVSKAAEDKALSRALETKVFPPVAQALQAKLREEKRKERARELPSKRSHRIFEKQLERKAVEEQEFEERRAARMKQMAALRRKEEEERERELAASRSARFAKRNAEQSKTAASPTNRENAENHPKRRSGRTSVTTAQA